MNLTLFTSGYNRLHQPGFTGTKNVQKFNGLGQESAFLWGARQTGKSTLLRKLYPDATYIDLLLNSEYDRFPQCST
jgi:predicted AAA+ superfamily ATPase